MLFFKYAFCLNPRLLAIPMISQLDCSGPEREFSFNCKYITPCKERKKKREREREGRKPCFNFFSPAIFPFYFNALRRSSHSVNAEYYTLLTREAGVGSFVETMFSWSLFCVNTLFVFCLLRGNLISNPHAPTPFPGLIFFLNDLMFFAP